MASTISSPIFLSIDSTYKLFRFFFIFPKAISTLMLSYTLLFIVLRYFSSIGLSINLYWDLLQNSVNTLDDIYPQVNCLFSLYWLSITYRIKELIRARPFLLSVYLIYDSSYYFTYLYVELSLLQNYLILIFLLFPADRATFSWLLV